MKSATGIQRQAPPWVRVGLHSLLIVGILAMHHLIVSQTLDPAAHHDGMGTTSSAVPRDAAVVGDAGPVPALVHDLGDLSGAMSDCGPLMALCVAMLMGISAFVFVRRRLASRVLWQLPPPRIIGLARRVPPFHTLTPLQRSAVLRC